MWLLDKIIRKPFERHVKNLANDERKIAGFLSRMLYMEGSELKVLEEEAARITDGTRIINALYSNTEQEKSNTEKERIHDSGNAIGISEEMRKIVEKEQLLRAVIGFNSDIYHQTVSQIDLLRRSHEVTISLKDLYNHMIQYNQTIGSHQSLLAIHHILENIKNLSNQKMEYVSQLDRIRLEKEGKRKAIIERCRRMKMDDEDIKKVAGDLIKSDKKDKKLAEQMSAPMQFAH